MTPHIRTGRKPRVYSTVGCGKETFTSCRTTVRGEGAYSARERQMARGYNAATSASPQRDLVNATNRSRPTEDRRLGQLRVNL